MQRFDTYVAVIAMVLQTLHSVTRTVDTQLPITSAI